LSFSHAFENLARPGYALAAHHHPAQELAADGGRLTAHWCVARPLAHHCNDDLLARDAVCFEPHGAPVPGSRKLRNRFFLGYTGMARKG